MEEVMNKIADALRNLPPELRGSFIVLIEAREDGKTVTVHPAAAAFTTSIRKRLCNSDVGGPFQS